MSQLPCPGKPIGPTILRPPWCDKGTVTVTDPLFGDVALVVQARPLRCWKSALLADGSAWLWRSDPWHDNPLTPTSGLLMFAPTWESWQLMTFLSQQINKLSSVWEGPEGLGRLSGLQVSVQCSFG